MINPTLVFVDIIKGLRGLPPRPIKIDGVISLRRLLVVNRLRELADHIEEGGPPPNLEDQL